MKHPENEFSQNHSLKRLSCSAASGIKSNNSTSMLNLSKPEFYFPMRHPVNEFSQSHGQKWLSCSAASGNNRNNDIGMKTIKS